ncbi:MAG: hypothetical protein K8S25_05925 [Alphaproteobacteria bacterium]|nr:hypothetical protein [Alphaproteobacteria bacterium]
MQLPAILTLPRLHEVAGPIYLVLLLIEYALAPAVPLSARLRYIFAPPGWSHDQSRQDSHNIKADYVRAHPQEAGTPGLPKLPAV